MCEPVTIGLAAVALAGVAVQYYQNDQNVKGQNKANKRQSEEGAALAAESFRNQAKLVGLRQSEEAEAASMARQENAKEGAKARASARTAAGEAGVAGLSVESLVDDFYRQEAGYDDSIKRNLTLSHLQAGHELKGLHALAMDRNLANQREKLQRPSYLAAGVDGANQSLNIYNRYRYTSASSSGRTT